MTKISSLIFIWLLLHSFSPLQAKTDFYLGAKENSSLRLDPSRQILFRKIVNPENLNLFKKQSFMYLIKGEAEAAQSYGIELKKTETGSAIYNALWAPGLMAIGSPIKIYSLNGFSGTLPQRMNKAKELLKKGRLKPLSFLGEGKAKSQTIEIFESADEARWALNIKKSLLSLPKLPSDNLSQVGVGIDGRQTNAPKYNAGGALQSFLVKGAGQINQTPIRQKSDFFDRESKRRFQAKWQSSSWSESIKKVNQQKARVILARGFEYTKSGQLKKATKRFLEASDLYPKSELLYHHYGVALHREGRYLRSNVVLSLARPEGRYRWTNTYFRGLNGFKLREYAEAAKKFKEVQQSNLPQLKVKAAFHEGLCLQALAEYEKARQSFQYVLDHSESDELDRKAEAYIEDGLRREARAKRASKRFFYQGVIGLFYDSNIVLAIDGQANQQTDQEGVRFLLSNQLQYKYFAGEQDDLKIGVKANLIQSQKTDFGSSATLEAADPWVFGVSAPWDHRGTLWGNGYSFQLNPEYEVISMDLDDSSKKDIIHSTVLNFSQKRIMSDRWILNNTNQIRRDDARPSTGTITDDADAFKFSSDWSAILVLNREKEKYLIPQVGFSMNDAQGDDFAYSRFDLSLTYTSRISEKLLWTNRGAYYHADYRSVRVDDNYSLATGLAYPVGVGQSLGLNASFQENQSNTNNYDKFQIFSTYSFSF